MTMDCEITGDNQKYFCENKLSGSEICLANFILSGNGVSLGTYLVF
jgi:hypothetical protein